MANSAKLVRPPNQKAQGEVKITNIFDVKPTVVDKPPSNSRTKYEQPKTFQPSSTTGAPPVVGIEISAAKSNRSVPQAVTAVKTDEPQADKRFIADNLTDEQVQEYMITLPPAELSDTTKLKTSDLDTLLQSTGKSQNQHIIDYQRELAIMFFQKDFIIGKKIDQAGKFCTIAEIEFYPEYDPYRPSDEAFGRSGGFYLRLNPNHHDKHTAVRQVLYITMENAGGMLIRSIITPEGFVEGPENVVDYIIQQNPDGNLSLALTDIVFDANNEKVNTSKYTLSMMIYNGPRVGLDLRQETALYGRYCMFVMKPYRYTFCPGQLKIHKHTLAVTARLNGVPDSMINADFKLPVELLGRWLILFGRGESCYMEMFLEGKNRKLKDSQLQLLAYGFLSRFNK